MSVLSLRDFAARYLGATGAVSFFRDIFRVTAVSGRLSLRERVRALALTGSWTGALRLPSSLWTFGTTPGTVRVKGTTVSPQQEFTLTITRWDASGVEAYLPEAPIERDVAYTISAVSPEGSFISESRLPLPSLPLCVFMTEPLLPKCGGHSS
jgi:hypothetical protein